MRSRLLLGVLVVMASAIPPGAAAQAAGARDAESVGAGARVTPGPVTAPAPPVRGTLAVAQPCPDGSVRDIRIVNHSIFRTGAQEERRFAWAYDLVNTLHVRTREEFIARELLFEPGSCFDVARLRESERLLREFRFISTASVTPVPRPDGNHDVVVDTRDEWTTRINVRMATEEGFRIEGIDLREENFLGRGMLVGIFHRDRDERQDFGFEFETPYLFGTRWNAGLMLGRTRVGWLVDQTFVFPFVGEYGRLAARQRFLRREGLFTWATGAETGYSHVVVPVFDERFEVAGAIRFGRPGGLTMLGFGVSRDAVSFFDFPEGAELASDGDFGDMTPAPLEVTESLQSQITPRSTTRLNILFGLRNVRFERRRGLDSMKGVQDVQLGSDLGLTLGQSFEVLRTGPAPNDIFARVDLFGGASSDDWVVQGKLNVEGRRVFENSGRTWRDVLLEFDTYVYHQPPRFGRHTLFARISTSGGWSVEAPFQLTLGGRDGLRGYREEAFPVGRRTFLTMEDRISFDWPAPNFMDFGLTLFAEVGAGAGGDVPFGRDTGLKGSAGAGLRFGFPAGTAGVVRADFAVPLGEGVGWGDVIFRLSLSEILGIARGYGDRQMERSLRAGVGSDFQGLAH